MAFVQGRHGRLVSGGVCAAQAPPVVPVGLPDPVPNGLGRGFELPRQLLRRPPLVDQLNDPLPERRRIRPMTLRHRGLSFPQRWGVHETGSSPLRRAGVEFRKNDNAFLWVADRQALQAAADRLSAQIIRKRLDYWTWVVGPKFSAKDRQAINLGRHYSLQQVEYCRNVI